MTFYNNSSIIGLCKVRTLQYNDLIKENP